MSDLNFAPAIPVSVNDEIEVIDAETVSATQETEYEEKGLPAEAYDVANAYANNRSMEATKDLMNDKDKLAMMEVIAANPEKFSQDDPAWLVIHAIATLRNLETDLVKHVAEAAAAELIKVKVESAKRQAEAEDDFKKYADNAKKHIENTIRESSLSYAKKTVNAINSNVNKVEAKMTESMSESLVKVAREVAMKAAAAKSDINKPWRWVALAIAGLAIINIGSYAAGTMITAQQLAARFAPAIADQQQWAGFVDQFGKATQAEKAVIEKVMTRS